MAGSWEISPYSVLVEILHTDFTTIAWAFGLRTLQLPPGSKILGLSGMPYDHARNQGAMHSLEVGATHLFCLRKDSVVETTEGGKRMEDVEIGDIVRTHLGNFRSVTQVFRRDLQRTDKLIWVRTKHGVIKCTAEHPFFVSRDKAAGRFIRADNLQTGDLLLYPDRWHEDWLKFDVNFNTIGVNGDGKLGAIKNGQHLGSVPVTRELARFLGLYLAEGCCHSDGICFTFNNNEEHLIDLVSSMAKTLFGRKVNIVRRWSTNVKINVRPLGKLFEGWFGRYAKTKKIPEFVFGWSMINRLSFLQGYLQGDGCLATGKDKNGHDRTPIWSFIIASSELMAGIENLSRICGLQVKKIRIPAKVAVISTTGQEIKGTGAWQGWFARKSGDKMGDLLEADRNDDYLCVPVYGVEKKKVSWALKNRSVYNLEVAEDNSYIADCSAVHNCLDSDVIAPPDAVMRLLSHNLPIVSGLYCRRSPPWSVPVAIKDGRWLEGFRPGSLVEVDVVGAGCLLIRRDVLEQLPPQRPGHHWFDWRVNMKGTEGYDPAKCMSEDFTLIQACREKLGVKTYVDTSIQCQHVGLASATHGLFKPLDVTPIP